VAKRKMTHILNTKLNNSEHKVKVVGDSHLRGMAAKINQYLNLKFEIFSWIKPRADTKELVDTLEKILNT
jgi:hypothetical protein